MTHIKTHLSIVKYLFTGVAVVNGKIYVMGGEEGWDRYHDTVESYDPEVDRWDIVGEMSSSRSWLSCVALMVNFNHKQLVVSNHRLSAPSCHLRL